MRFVLDASVAVKWFVPEPQAELALPLFDSLRAGGLSLVAPDSVVAEFGHALRKLVVGRKMTSEESRHLIADFAGLSFITVPIRPLAADAMRLCTTYGSTFYDALYMSLALREDLKLITADEGLASAFASLDRTLLLRDLVL